MEPENQDDKAKREIRWGGILLGICYLFISAYFFYGLTVIAIFAAIAGYPVPSKPSTLQLLSFYLLPYSASFCLP